ncbi:hypothetical protein [Actinomadura sp. CNU-125]|uniref:hypothetical protein n=1 Tax=Actinomadura sp. CNU-125 TaxID=1904961 RepID=UPI0021CCFA88|nr:hypothetical protein [Actinomadura sp. CNU-125]
MGTAAGIDLVDPDSYAREGPPYDHFARLREHSPVHWHETGGGDGWPGFWAVTRHRDIARVSRDTRVFSSHRRLALFDELPAEAARRQRLMMINMDPPRHTVQRALVGRMFTPRAVDGLRERIGEICAGLLDTAARRGAADFVRDIAAPLPARVLCELIGAPRDEHGLLADIIGRLADESGTTGGGRAEGAAGPGAFRRDAAAQLYAYAADLAERRREEPRDDIVSRLLAAGEHGEALTTDAFFMIVLMLAIAGTETTAHAAAGGCSPSSSIRTSGGGCWATVPSFRPPRRRSCGGRAR